MKITVKDDETKYCKHDRKKYSGNDDHQYVECLDCDWYEEL